MRLTKRGERRLTGMELLAIGLRGAAIVDVDYGHGVSGLKFCVEHCYSQ